jgi:glycosyltransferase involved in cell wall biosynthesis
VSQPFISVVTPFHNTSLYLAQCIESVLAQSYSAFEYILVDNCSTDGSSEIAEEYSRRDPRIRLVRRPQLLSQVQNYNRALDEISETSRYCKIVQADDFILPECLRLMVAAMEQSESVGLVSSYWIKGSEVRGSNFPYPSPIVGGKEVARLYLRTGVWVFGSPTTVMYRSSLVKKGEPFYDEARLHEDTEKCMQILQQWDFGFVHQVLSFSRADNASISTAVRHLAPNSVDRYISVNRYAAAFLDRDEAEALKRTTRREYYSVLASAVLHGRKSTFWQYHAKGLATLGDKIDWPYLSVQVVRELMWKATNPGSAVLKVLRYFTQGIGTGTTVTTGRSARNTESPRTPEHHAC